MMYLQRIASVGLERIQDWCVPANVQGRIRGADSLVCPFLPHTTRTGNVIPIPRTGRARPALGQTRLSAPRLPARTGYTFLKSALILLLFSVTAMAAAPSPASISLDAGYTQMYNLQFPAAHQVFAQWEQR